MRISAAEPDRAIAILKENLRRFARALEVKRLEARGGPSKVGVEVLVWRADPSCKEACSYLPRDRNRDHPYRQLGPYDLTREINGVKRGDLLTFTLSNRDRTSHYAYLLNISADGAIQSIFPSRFHNREEARLKPEERRDLMKETALLLDVAGAETIKLIATQDPIDVRLFESEGYDELRGERGGLNPLERLLAAAMYTRDGNRVVDMRESEWSTLQAEFQVGE